MKFRAIVEYEYPIEHKPPVKAEIVLHGDRVTTENIKRIDEEHYEDCVSRERVLSMALYKFYNAKQIIGSAGSLTSDEIIRDWDDMFDFVENLPFVRPTRAKGKWIKTFTNDQLRVKCSECEYEVSAFWNDWEKAKYCPNCGAEMTE